MRERVFNKRLRLQETARAQKNSPAWRNALAEARQALGARVRKLRRSKGWSQAEFAWQSGLNLSYVGKIERGSNDVRVSTLIRLARPLAVRASALLKGIA